ncbi:putative plant lipid transfer protein/Par allergen [Rosa chinensis]|uniref:Non-specific lipid-transfer protein n=1 Tax=Rosa chinensis TaxID=74649 RepID=A0A2P6R8F4_ROSCH|nr:non-specific lipid-transfer protein 1 [Rosa chinensis]PRQ42715.1 putative plant lipid transfer protein/Par allergen [Rosa chinensis]
MASAVVKLTLVALMCIVVAVPVAQAITCGQVTQSLAACINYVKTGGSVPPACCNGIRSLNSQAKTTADRKQTCTCLKNAAGSIPGVNPNLASGLPGKCGVSVPYKISTSTNCNNVK